MRRGGEGAAALPDKVKGLGLPGLLSSPGIEEDGAASGGRHWCGGPFWSWLQRWGGKEDNQPEGAGAAATVKEERKEELLS